MICTKEDLRKLLLKQISIYSDPNQLGAFAYNIFFQHCRDLDPELKDILERLSMMEEGKEFWYTQDELQSIIEKLQKKQIE